MLQEIQKVLLGSESGTGYIYPPGIFDMRLKEEILRSNRSRVPFILIEIETKHFDLYGFEKTNDKNITAWKIAVLTIFSNTSIIDLKGFLPNNRGLGVLLINKTIEDIQQIKKQILRNLRDAKLLEKIRLKPQNPFFKAYFNSGKREREHQNSIELMKKFNYINEGFFTIESLHYSDISKNRWNDTIIDAFKRVTDVTGAGLGIIALSPLYLIIAGAVKISDPKGPVFFKQRRVGKNNSIFEMYKFRSMYVDAEERLEELKKSGRNEADGPVFKMKNDPRITPIGRFIRKYSVDELPQLFNIIKGEMSIVGPRPPIPDEVLDYLPWHKMRLSVKPGLTCHWQVSGRSNIGFEEWMRLDNKYVRHGNLKEDFRLIGKTFKVVFKGEGAY